MKNMAFKNKDRNLKKSDKKRKSSNKNTDYMEKVYFNISNKIDLFKEVALKPYSEYRYRELSKLYRVIESKVSCSDAQKLGVFWRNNLLGSVDEKLVNAACQEVKENLQYFFFEFGR